MGDLSEYRGLLVAGCLIGVFAFLIMAMPSQFISSEEQNVRGINYPTSWSSADLLYLAETHNVTSISNTTDTTFQIGGRDFRLKGGWTSTFNNSLIFYHKVYWWIFETSSEPCLWLNEQGKIVDTANQNSLQMIDLDAGSYDPDEERFIAKWTEYSQFEMYVIFSWNTTLYTGWNDAMDNAGLSMWVGVQFDQTNTSYNAWDIIGMVLFFQLPDVHPVINGLVSIPAWITIAYCAYILILRAIGAVFGGGGA